MKTRSSNTNPASLLRKEACQRKQAVAIQTQPLYKKQSITIAIQSSLAIEDEAGQRRKRVAMKTSIGRTEKHAVENQR